MSHKVQSMVFWGVLITFLAWDWMSSPAVDLRKEPSWVAAGSGQATQGAHCSTPSK